MKMFNKFIFSSALAVQLLIAGSLYSDSAYSAPRCSIRNLVEESAQPARKTDFQINEISGVDKIKLKAKTVTKLKKIFERLGMELNSTKIKEIIETVAGKVKGRTKNPSIEKSNKMAEIGRELLKAVELDLTVAQYKVVNYMIAESVLRLESIKASDYKSGPELQVFRRDNTVHIDKFHKLVESYVDGTPMYERIREGGGILDWVDIRGLYSNNSWIIAIKNHDMYHLHYAYGHPYYLAVNMHASRTINDRRYAMISSLWEAVDTFRTSYESAIARFVHDRQMTVEEGMLYLASATEKELDAIEQVIGSHTQVGSFRELSYEEGWRPIRTNFGRDSAANEIIYLKEITDFISKSLEKLKDKKNKKYANYHRKGPGQESDRDEAGVAGY